MAFALGWPRAAAARCSRVAGKKDARGSLPDELRAFVVPLPTARARFAHSQRLHTPAEFARVFADAIRSTDRFFTVLARANDRPHARLGLTVSRRAAKHAVDRNRVKRIAREAFRCAAALPRCDFVVLAKPPAAGAPRAELRRSLEEHFERLTQKAVVGRNG